MHLRFSTQPGRHERHLRRRHQNPLFGRPAPQAGRGELDRARSLDQRELQDFMQGFDRLIQEAAQLEPNADSESVLRLKERLDKAYEQAAGLAGDLAPIKQSIAKLVGAIMQAVRLGAGTDPQATRELQQEDAAREMHFTLLEHPLVADLLSPDSLIGPDELVPALLCAQPGETEAALNLFDEPQLRQMLEDARALIDGLDDPAATGRYRPRLTQIEQRLGILTAQRH